MNTILKKTMISTAVLLALTTSAYASSAAPTIVQADSLQWHEVSNLPPGAKVAILVGNPEKKEAYVARLMLPAGYAIPVHSHPVNEYDTVLSGTLLLGVGNTSGTLTAGSFVMIPKGVKHYTQVKEQTILQISGMGPWGMIYK